MARVGQRLGRGTAEASGAVASLQFFIEAVVTLFSSVARSRLTLCDPMDCSEVQVFMDLSVLPCWSHMQRAIFGTEGK